VELMVGRVITELFPKEEADITDELLRVENLSCNGIFEHVSFSLHRGEILGIAGLIGAGRSEVMETLFGIRKKSSGKIYVEGKQVHIHDPGDAIQNRMAMLTEDRKYNGCFQPLSVWENIGMASVSHYCKKGFVKKKGLLKAVKKLQGQLRIKTPGFEQKMVNLSGGNQQKVLVGRWSLTSPDILIVDEPTRGIDVGTKSEIHKILTNLAKEGKGIIMISSELPEVMGMSDRILVMSEGKITGELDMTATQEEIMHLAASEGTDRWGKIT